MTGGGQQLVETLHDALTRVEIPVLYETPAVPLISEGGRIAGVHVSQHDREHELPPEDLVARVGRRGAHPGGGPGENMKQARGRYTQGAGEVIRGREARIAELEAATGSG